MDDDTVIWYHFDMGKHEKLLLAMFTDPTPANLLVDARISP